MISKCNISIKVQIRKNSNAGERIKTGVALPEKKMSANSFQEMASLQLRKNTFQCHIFQKLEVGGGYIFIKNNNTF